jgi:hypothetical protein
MKTLYHETLLTRVVTLLDILRLEDVINCMECFKSVCVTADFSKWLYSTYEISDSVEDFKITIHYNMIFATCYIDHHGHRVIFDFRSKRILMRAAKQFIDQAQKDELIVYLPKPNIRAIICKTIVR